MLFGVSPETCATRSGYTTFMKCAQSEGVYISLLSCTVREMSVPNIARGARADNSQRICPEVSGTEALTFLASYAAFSSA